MTRGPICPRPRRISTLVPVRAAAVAARRLHRLPPRPCPRRLPPGGRARALEVHALAMLRGGPRPPAPLFDGSSRSQHSPLLHIAVPSAYAADAEGRDSGTVENRSTWCRSATSTHPNRVASCVDGKAIARRATLLVLQLRCRSRRIDRSVRDDRAAIDGRDARHRIDRDHGRRRRRGTDPRAGPGTSPTSRPARPERGAAVAARTVPVRARAGRRQLAALATKRSEYHQYAQARRPQRQYDRPCIPVRSTAYGRDHRRVHRPLERQDHHHHGGEVTLLHGQGRRHQPRPPPADQGAGSSA